MELSEAKEIIKNIITDEEYQKAIDTILNYIEKESIPKEKIREKIKELGKDIPIMTPRYFDWDSCEVIKLLQKLLGDDE